MKIFQWKYLLLLLTAFLMVLPVSAQRRIKVRRNSVPALELAFRGIKDRGTIIIPEGRYEIEKPLELTGKSYVRIIGRGDVEIVQMDPQEAVIRVLNGVDIGISGLHLFHGTPQSDFECQGVVLSLDDVANVRVENCDLNGCGTWGVYGTRVEGLKLINNFIHNNSIAAVEVRNDYGQGEMSVNGEGLSEYFTVSGNVILNNGSFETRLASLSNGKEWVSGRQMAGVLSNNGRYKSDESTDEAGLKIFATGSLSGRFAGTEWGDFGHFNLTVGDYLLSFMVVGCPEFETFDQDLSLWGRRVRVEWIEREFDLREFSGAIERGFAITRIELVD